MTQTGIVAVEQTASSAAGAAPAAMARRRASGTNRYAVLRSVSRVGVYLLLAVGCLAYGAPLLWMISTSLKTPAAIMAQPPQWLPNPVVWRNYTEALTILPFNLFLRNTVFITFWTMVGVALSCTIVAYGFARLSFRGRDFWFVVLLSTMMLPGQVTMIPVFMIFRALGWINTFKPLIVPSFFGDAFFIFLLRQFYMTIPRELDDAATVDGCGRFTILWRIHVHLMKPALAAVAVFSFINGWNDFMGPLIYLTDMKMMTLAVGLNLFRGQYYSYMHYMMAASTATLMPVLAVFFIAQKYFIQGITLTGIKG
jgi:ABC-type glycerol-3-phosphate transport system permease component